MRIGRILVLLFGFGWAAVAPPAAADTDTEKALRLVAFARAQIGHTLIYDSRYQKIAYPMGDIPLLRGVCADVVIRAFRGFGIDLQQGVHEDMRRNFSAYPRNWGLERPDSNIDHRRVPNLMAFFARQGKSLPISEKSEDYKPGDIVTWRLAGGQPHIGIVSDRRSLWTDRPLIIHNIGLGAQEEDRLFDFVITGHYRWF